MAQNDQTNRNDESNLISDEDNERLQQQFAREADEESEDQTQ